MNRALSARRARGIIVLGIACVVVGILVILTTLDTSFIAVNSSDVRFIRIIHLDGFGGLLVVIVGTLALAGGRARRTGAAVAGGVMASLMTLWAFVGMNTSINLMGARADTFALLLMVSSGLLLFTLTPDPDA